MADKPIQIVSGVPTEVEAKVVSAGGADAGKIVALDAAGRLDESVMPVGIGADVFVGDSAESLTAGDFCYVDADGEVAKASAASGGHDADGFVKASYTTGQPVTLYLTGQNEHLTGLTPMQRIYLSDTIPGGFTTTPPTGAGKRLQFLGRALSATSMDFKPSDGIVRG